MGKVILQRREGKERERMKERKIEKHTHTHSKQGWESVGLSNYCIHFSPHTTYLPESHRLIVPNDNYFWHLHREALWVLLTKYFAVFFLLSPKEEEWEVKVRRERCAQVWEKCPRSFTPVYPEGLESRERERGEKGERDSSPHLILRWSTVSLFHWQMTASHPRLMGRRYTC